MGTLEGLAPEADQRGFRPVEKYTELRAGATISGRERTVAVKPDWSFGEILMEPIGYNPNLSGWWGSKILDSNEWLIKDREKRRGVKLLRSSRNRILLAKSMYLLLKRMAERGVTHIHHIIKEGTDGSPIHIMGFREFRLRYGDATGAPRTQEQYQDLCAGIPAEWRDVIDRINEVRPFAEGFTNVERAMAETPHPGSWVQRHDGLVGQVVIKGVKTLHIGVNRLDKRGSLAEKLEQDSVH